MAKRNKDKSSWLLLGKKIKFLRKACDLNQTDFVRLFDSCAIEEDGKLLNQEKLSRVENGLLTLKLEHLFTMKRFCDLDIDDLMNDVSYEQFTNKYSCGFKRNTRAFSMNETLLAIVQGKECPKNYWPLFTLSAQGAADAIYFYYLMIGMSPEDIKSSGVVYSALKKVREIEPSI